MRSLLRILLTWLYKVDVQGLDNIKKAGDRVLIVANHLSFLDAVLIAAFIPEKLTFAVNTYVAKCWWMRPIMWLFHAYPLDPTNPMATKGLIDEIKKGRKCVIFPEGRITVTGSLMKIYEGPGMIADKSGATVLPIRIDGAQYSPFSRLKGKVRIRWLPKIKMIVMPPYQFDVPEEIKGRARRQASGTKLYDVMTELMFQSSNRQLTLFESMLDVRTIHGKKHPIALDIERKPITYGQLATRSFVLGDAIAKKTMLGEYVGVLLPNAVTTLVTFFALHAYNRVPAMLNFSTGNKNVVSACKTAEIKRVLTSRRFIDAANLMDMVKAVEKAGAEVVYLEDLKKRISLFSKLKVMILSMAPNWYYKRVCPKPNPDWPAVILFTSGSEGVPKGVVLSHKNIQANRMQLASRVDFGPTDIVFNALPMFHSFGLTGGTLLPILSGIKTFFYPSPLHYRIVPELAYDVNATILFGTDTFLSGYAKHAHPYDFYSVRYVFAGAEKLKEETRKVWSEKFGVRIFEGYGATETSPVLSTNTPMQNKPGTVGRLMPGIEYKLEDVPGIEEGGRLIVKGPNVMLGYLLADSPGQLVGLEGGWYDTGDIVSIDGEDYITIKGRAKRFAKIAGEMVSLTAVEQYISDLWPGILHAVVSIPDEKKGEQLVLVTQHKGAERTDIVNYVQKTGSVNYLFLKRLLLSMPCPCLALEKPIT